MIYCKNCGVELEDNMNHCPLCGLSVADNSQTKNIHPGVPFTQQYSNYDHRKMNQPQKKFTWEIVSIILLTGVISCFIIDFAMNRRITWSEYPAAICLTIFSYVSFFAFWNQRTIIDIAGGLIASSIFILIIDASIGGITWAIKVGIPLLITGNLIAAALHAVIRKSKYNGINIIAYFFIAAALLCICIEGVISFFETSSIHLWWSLIVTACILPVSFLLLFLHFKLHKGRNLQKTFHV